MSFESGDFDTILQNLIENSGEKLNEWLHNLEEKNDFVESFVNELHSVIDGFVLSKPDPPKRVKIHTVQETTPNLNDSQAFPALGSTSNAVTPTKRVSLKPVAKTKKVAPVTSAPNNKFSSAKYDIAHATSDRFSSERDNLKEIKSSQLTFDSLVQKKTEESFKIDFNYEQVNDKKLEILARIYFSLITKYFLNITESMSFVLQILHKDLKAPKNAHNSPISVIIDTAPKCFHFAFLMFESLLTSKLYYALDSSVLNILLANRDLLGYSPNNKIIEQNLKQLIEEQNMFAEQRAVGPWTQRYVPFNISKDSIDNFASSFGFSQFRKQRDSFVTLLESYYTRGWKSNLMTDEKAAQNFSTQINETLATKHYFKFNNHYHFARLFVNQMCKSCNNKSFIHMSQEVKVQKLAIRLTQMSGNRDFFATLFREEELFFKDFILYGNSSIFNTYVLLVMNDQFQTTLFELLQIVTQPDNEGHEEQFSFSMQKLLLLAKFMGFVRFYPFHATIEDKQRSPNNVYHQVLHDIRSTVLFDESWNTFEKLQNAIHNRALSLTVPWIVQYLSMADSSTLKLESFEKTVRLLCAVYRRCLPKMEPTLGSLFLRLSLEQFFEVHSINPNQLDIGFFDSYEFQVDDIYTRSTFYSCAMFHDFFPRLSVNVKEILEGRLPLTRAKTTKLVCYPLSTSRTRLKDHQDTQFQKALYERLYSSCELSENCKDATTFIVEFASRKTIEKIQETLQVVQKEGFSNILLDSQTPEHLAPLSHKLRLVCYEKANEVGVQQVRQVAEAIFYSEFTPEMRSLIVQLCELKVRHRCMKWFEREYSQDQFLDKFKLAHKAQADVSAFVQEKFYQVIETVKEYCAQLFTDADVEIDYESLIANMKISYHPHYSRSQEVFKYLSELIIVIMATHPKKLTPEFRESLLSFLLESNMKLDHLITVKHIRLMEASPCSIDTWRTFESFLLTAFSRGVVSFETIQCQVLSTMRVDFEMNTMRRFVNVVESFWNAAQAAGVEKSQDEDSKCILDWVIWILKNEHGGATRIVVVLCDLFDFRNHSTMDAQRDFLAQFSAQWPKVVLFGDSLTQRSFDPKTGCWGAFLADKLQRVCDVIPRGFSGYNSRWCREIAPKIFADFQPSEIACVVILLGANDASEPDSCSNQHVPLEEYSDNLEYFIHYLASIGVPKNRLIFLTPPPYYHEVFAATCAPDEIPKKSNELTRKYAQACKEIIEKNGVTLLDVFETFSRDPQCEQYFEDGIHFSLAGAEALFKLLDLLVCAKVEQHIGKPVNFDLMNFPYWRDVSLLK